MQPVDGTRVNESRDGGCAAFYQNFFKSKR